MTIKTFEVRWHRGEPRAVLDFDAEELENIASCLGVRDAGADEMLEAAAYLRSLMEPAVPLPDDVKPVFYRSDPERCTARARKGTGEGICDLPIMEHGYCLRPGDHL